MTNIWCLWKTKVVVWYDMTINYKRFRNRNPWKLSKESPIPGCNFCFRFHVKLWEGSVLQWRYHTSAHTFSCGVRTTLRTPNVTSSKFIAAMIANGEMTLGWLSRTTVEEATWGNVNRVINTYHKLPKSTSSGVGHFLTMLLIFWGFLVAFNIAWENMIMIQQSTVLFQVFILRVVSHVHPRTCR